ncbi:hypothetical protein ACQ4PT_006547 [Festuca glaucescens]
MATRNTIPPRTGPSLNPSLRQPVPPRSTPVRADARGADDTNKAAMQAAIPGHGRDGHGDQQLRPVAAEQGSMLSLGGRQGERREEGFNGQGFDGFEEGYYEGNNGYGNGYGYINRGNYRQRPYRQQYFHGNRGRSNNFRGGTGRFNGNGNRFQRYFNNNENAVATTSAQSQDGNATQVVAHGAGLSEAHPSSQNMETSSIDSLSTRAQKKIDKMVCLRCGENGHLAESCVVVLCIYCEKISHLSINFPLLSMPKPVAITYGVSWNELMFHEVPASSDVTFRHDSGKVGKISVTDGVLSPQEIAKELEWIIPGNHQWDLWPTDDGAFKVIFPTKADLARMTKIINVPVSGTSMFLHFEEWSAADLDQFYLTKGYGLLFKVKGEKGKEKTDEIMQEANPKDDSKGSDGQDNESSKKDEPPPMGGPAKSSMNNSNPPKSDFPTKQTHDLSLPVLRVGKTGSFTAETGCISPVTATTVDNFVAQPPCQIVTTLNLDAQEVEHGLQNIKMVHELEQESLTVSPPMVQARKAAPCVPQRVLEVPIQSQTTTPQGCIEGMNDKVFEATYPSHIMKGYPIGAISNKPSLDPFIREATHSGIGTGVFLGGRFSMEDVMAYGGIASPAIDVRSSERIHQQYNADATQLDRAQQLAQAKDAVFLQGVDENQVAASIDNIKEIDHNRTLIVLSKNLEDKNKEVINNQTEIIDHASDLSSDLCNEDKQNDEVAPSRK